MPVNRPEKSRYCSRFRSRSRSRSRLFLSTLSKTVTRLVCLLGLLLTIITYVTAIDISTLPSDVVFIEDTLHFEILWPESLMYTYKLRQAKDFGSSFSKVQHNVHLILADPEEGCQDLYNDVKDAVVLILRGSCSFLTKTRTAERAGALAAIIADNDVTNDANMIDMIDDSTERVVHIPSYFLLGKDGSMIRHQLSVIGSDHAIINIPVNLTGKPFKAAKRPPWTIW